MGSHNWQLFAALNLARYQGNALEVAKIEALISEDQERCRHVPNPERPERCYKCGFEETKPAAEPKPGPVKARFPIDKLRKAAG